MGWRFRKSFSPIPGFRLTISPSGLSTSIGVGPVHLTHGPRGAAATANLFGTGLSHRQPLGGPAAAAGETERDVSVLAPPAFPEISVSGTPGMAEIGSAGSAVLTSAGLAAFRQSLAEARTQYAEIECALQGARHAEQIKVDLHDRWAKGWLLRHVRKARFAQSGRRRRRPPPFVRSLSSSWTCQRSTPSSRCLTASPRRSRACASTSRRVHVRTASGTMCQPARPTKWPSARPPAAWWIASL